MVTKREYLVSKGLAKPGKGRFSADAKAELAKAEAEGMTFDDPAPAEPKSPKATTVKVGKQAEAPVETTKSDADPAAVRKWAKENGVTVSERGRISETVKVNYEQAMAAKGDKPVIRGSVGTPGVKDVRQHGPLLVSEDTVYVTLDGKKVDGVTYKTACSKGVSIGYCGEPTHEVVTAHATDGLVTVRPM